MAESTFRTQIEEDVAYYQELRPYLDNSDKPEWMFNLWVLDKLFGEDLDSAIACIIDYHDAGVDCYVWHEETHDLYLIQNKYYDDNSTFTASYFNETVNTAYQLLADGNYKHCADLQNIFSANKIHDDFRVYHYFYVTNNNTSPQVAQAVQKFNNKHLGRNRTAEVFYLEDIRSAFYGEQNRERKTFQTRIYTINNGTVLKILNQPYGLGFDIDAHYVMLPVATLYNLLREAEKSKYPIFDANIREYLGAGRTVNKGIIKTLESETDRTRFFFYNNGITIICSDLRFGSFGKKGLPVIVKNPQIVNGCQTVSSIQHVLSAYPDSELDAEFKDVFVMAKMLIIPDNPDNQEYYDRLRFDIVRYNNSQNSIDEKSFAANSSFFQTVQREFEAKGFLVMLKQSDRETYTKKYKGRVDALRSLADPKLKQFGLDQRVRNLRDFMVPLDKLMQILLAFVADAQQASQKKGALLKTDSSQWKLVTDAIQHDNELTTSRMLDLYLLYLRSEYEKANNAKDNRVPITWYLIDGFSRYECGNEGFAKVSEMLSTKEKVDSIIRLYTLVCSAYLYEYIDRNKDQGKGYNDMIKEKVNYSDFESKRNAMLAAISFGID